MADADAQGAAAENADEGDFQDTTSKFGGATTQIQGGSSPASGPRLETNKLYQSTIVPGEMQTFTVPARWGQSIASSINVMPVTNDQAGKLNRKTDSLPRIATSLIGADGEPHSVTSRAVDKTGSDTETPMVTDPIVHAPGSSALTDQAGDHTVTVAMSDDEALAGSEFGYQLYVQAVGDILPPPNYQTYEESLTATPSPSDSRTTATAGPTTKGPSSATSVKHILLVVGGSLGIWFTTRRRRCRARARRGAWSTQSLSARPRAWRASPISRARPTAPTITGATKRQPARSIPRARAASRTWRTLSSRPGIEFHMMLIVSANLSGLAPSGLKGLASEAMASMSTEAGVVQVSTRASHRHESVPQTKTTPLRQLRKKES